jgi:hypothetical protein
MHAWLFAVVDDRTCSEERELLQLLQLHSERKDL